MKYISRILFVLAVLFVGRGTAQAQRDDLKIVKNATGVTIETYVSSTEPGTSYSASGTEAENVQHDQYLVLKVTPAEGKWLYKELLEVQVAGSPGGALSRAPEVKIAVNPTGISTNQADGTGYYYYQIPSECTAANGYKNVIVTGTSVGKIDLSTATIDGTGKVITKTTDGWTATITLDEVSWAYDESTHCPAISAFTLTNGTNSFTNTAAQVAISGAQTNAGNYNATLSAVTGGCFVNSKSVPFSIGKKATEITINIPPGGGDVGQMDVDDTYTSGATLSPTDAGSLTFSLSKESVVTVDADGVITAVGEGEVTITFSFPGNENYAAAESKTMKIQVSKVPTEITVSDPILNLKVHDECGTGAALTPAEAGSLTYTSDNEAVAKVEGGLIKCVGTGTAKITVSFAGDNKYAAADSKTITINVPDAASAVVTANNLTYDGTAQNLVTIGAITYGATGTAADVVFYESATSTTPLTAVPQGTNAGTYEVYYEVTPDADHIAPARAKVTVTISPTTVVVTIIGHNNTTVYDGKEHSVSGYDVELSTPLYTKADFTFSGTAEAKRTEKGQTNMELKAEQFTNTNKNFEVTFNVTDGYQKITSPHEVIVKITGHSSTDDYDGKDHSVEGYDVEISNPLYTKNDFTFSSTAIASAKRKDAGTTYMELNKEQFENTNSNFDIVTFVVVKDGYQTISPITATVTINGHYNTAVYDGKEHSVEGYDVKISNPLYKETDFTFSGTDIAARTDEGTTYMGLAKDQFTNTNENFINVTFTVTDGYQIITSVNDVVVTIIGESHTDDYDGEEHSVKGYRVEISNPLYKESDFTFSGTDAAARKDAGTTYMGLTASQFTNNNPDFTNVTFNVTDGYQTISPISATVEIKGHSDVDYYDGTEHKVSGYDVSFSNNLYLESYFTFSGGTASAAQTDQGTAYMGLAANQFANTSDNFINVTFTVTDGSMTILKKVVKPTVTVETKTYDGNTDAQVNVAAETGVTGESLTITGVTGTFGDANVGTDKTVTLDTKDAVVTAGNDKTKVTNYEVIYPETAKGTITSLDDGSLSVSFDSSIDDDFYIYNGQEKKPGVRVKDGDKELVKDQDYTVSYSNNVNAGENTASVTVKGIGNYDGSLASKNFSIKKASLTVIADPKTKEAGEEDPALTYTYEGLVAGDTKDVFTGALERSAGEEAGEYAIMLGNLTAGDNYAIAFQGAVFTITAKEPVKPEDPLYNIYVAESVGGEVVTTLTQAKKDQQVNIIVKTEDNYNLETLVVVNNSTHESVPTNVTTDKDNNDFTYFLMPDADVTVAATFVKQKPEFKQNIFIFRNYYGEVVSNLLYAEPGQQVNLETRVKNGYTNVLLDELYVFNEKGEQLQLFYLDDPIEKVPVHLFFMKGEKAYVYNSFKGTNGVTDETKSLQLDGILLYLLSEQYRNFLKTSGGTEGAELALSFLANILANFTSDGALYVNQGPEDMCSALLNLQSGWKVKFDFTGIIQLINPELLGKGEGSINLTSGQIYELLSPGNLKLLMKSSDGPLLINSITVIPPESQDPTAISGMRADKAAGDIFDLRGRKVDANTLKKGVYIRNGKKVVIK